jgi:hypothetical protein
LEHSQNPQVEGTVSTTVSTSGVSHWLLEAGASDLPAVKWDFHKNFFGLDYFARGLNLYPSIYYKRHDKGNR